MGSLIGVAARAPRSQSPNRPRGQPAASRRIFTSLQEFSATSTKDSIRSRVALQNQINAR
jgi:hypothetical protein